MWVSRMIRLESPVMNRIGVCLMKLGKPKKDLNNLKRHKALKSMSWSHQTELSFDTLTQ